MNPLPRERRVGAVLGNILTVLIAVQLEILAGTIGAGDRTIFGIHVIDARWLYMIAGILGVAAVRVAVARLPWLIALTLSTIGRSISLLIVGSPDLDRRVVELRGAYGLIVLWVGGLLAFVAARWADAVRRERERAE